MKVYVKYDINAVCKKVLQKQLDKLELPYAISGFGEVEFVENVPSEKLQELGGYLGEYGCEIVESSKSVLVQKIKDAIIEMVYMDDKLPSLNISVHLAERLGHSYGYIANVFSEVTYTSIGNYIILQKTERAKQMISGNELTFTEIAWKLNYSSLAHFSTQFKNATGLTPSTFQRIINRRREIVDFEE